MAFSTPTSLQRQLSLFERKAPPSHVLPTNTTADRYPFHRWFNFIAGFSPEFVEQCINTYHLNNESRILDPFAGCGTTLAESNLHGIASVGFEAHLFFAKICEAKLAVGSDPNVIKNIFENLVSVEANEEEFSTYTEPAQTFLKKLFPSQSLLRLVAARKVTERYTGSKALLALLILSRVLDHASHAKTDGIYKAPTSRKKPVPYEEALDLVCVQLYEDLKASQGLGLRNLAHLYHKSSEDMSMLEPASIDLMITSPPYLNNFDFAEMTRMYLYYWKQAGSWGEITDKVRSKLIVNTTTALKGHRDRIAQYRDETPEIVHRELDRYQKLLAQKRLGKAGKKEYDLLVYPYFAQMTRVLRGAYRSMRNGARTHIIVADSALYGIHILTHDILTNIMCNIGFGDVEIVKLRDRGTRWVLDKREGAKDGLGEFEIKATAIHSK